jgi:hypothetical protein
MPASRVRVAHARDGAEEANNLDEFQVDGFSPRKFWTAAMKTFIEQNLRPARARGKQAFARVRGMSARARTVASRAPGLTACFHTLRWAVPQEARRIRGAARGPQVGVDKGRQGYVRAHKRNTRLAPARAKRCCLVRV